MLNDINKKLDLILRQLGGIERLLLLEGKLIMSALEVLAAQVKANTDAEASAAVLIQGLAAEIAASAGDAPKIAALAAQLKSSGDVLAAAVVANTPHAAAPAPVEPAPVAPVVEPAPAAPVAAPEAPAAAPAADPAPVPPAAG